MEKAQELRWQVVEQLKSKINDAKGIESTGTILEVPEAVVSYVPPTDTANPQYYHKVVDCPARLPGSYTCTRIHKANISRQLQ